LGINRKANLPVLGKFLNFDTNITLAAQAAITKSKLINGNVSELQLGFRVTYICNDMPDKYKMQIRNTQFQDLENKLNSFIATNAIPEINKILNAGYVIPDIIQAVVTDISLNFKNNTVLFGCTVRDI